MGFRKQDRSLLAHWLKQQKQEIRKKDEALETGKLWFGRARLAAKEGKQQLAQEAHKRASEAKQAHDKAVRQLESIAMELDTLRGSVTRTEPIDSGAAARAEQIQQNFSAIGIDSGEAELNELANRSGAERALGRLRQSLNGPKDNSGDALEAFDDDRADISSSIPRLSELMERDPSLESAATKSSKPADTEVVADSSETSERQTEADVAAVDKSAGDAGADISSSYRDSGVAQEASSEASGSEAPGSETSNDDFAFEQLGPKSE